MFAYLRTLLDNADLSPHGICLLWRPELIWTHVVSDAIIALSYFSIPAAIAYFVSKRDIVFKPVAWAFILFITACGMTHVMSILTLWKPYYGIEGLVKVVTAFASFLTAAALWPLMPVALTWPSPRQLQSANDELRVRISERDAALTALQKEVATRTAMEQKLRDAQKMEALGQLTGGVAHDFNNLMTIVLNNVDRASRLIDDREKALNSLRDARTGAERAAALTRQLLVFSRQRAASPVDANVNTVLKDAGHLAKNLLPDNVTLHFDLEERLPDVKIDVNEAVNAVMNLVTNARDAITEGGEIRVATRRVAASEIPDARAPYIEVSVSDRGCGMAQDVIDHAFEPFFTTKPVGRGAGLGLSQVYAFARQSGGYAEIRSSLGKGTSVAILIPAEEAKP
jgi:signal transduction histidine kinase